MKRILGGFGVAALMLVVAGCEPHPITEAEMEGWADSVYDWQSRTYQTICEIAEAVDPTPGDDNYSEIGSATNAYCGPGGGGAPRNPPDWGA
jgi:hypothetical protein